MSYFRFLLPLVLAALLYAPLLPGDDDGEKAPQPKKDLELIYDRAPLGAAMKARTSFAPMIKRVAPSVVTIQAERVPKGHGRHPLFNDPKFKKFFRERPMPPGGGIIPSLGSGVIITTDGYILTNNHVIKDASRIKVLLHDKKRYSAVVVGTDPKTDIGVLKIDAPGKLPAAVIGDSKTVEVGDMSFAFGNPFGVGQTVTRGMVSALGRGNLGITAFDNFIQTDAAINRGNSGGALVDAKGRLIGINTAIVSSSGGSQGIGLAIPIDQVISVMQRLISHGRVVRGYLGLTVRAVRAEDVNFHDLKSQNGAVVTHVAKDSPAETAGLKKNDIVMKYNGVAVADDKQLQRLEAASTPGVEVKVEIQRAGAGMTLVVTVAESPEAEDSKIAGAGMMKNILRGVTVVDLTPKIRARIHAPRDLNGVVVDDLDPEAPAARAGLRVGDLVLEINRKNVGNARQAIKLTNDLKGKSVLLYVWSQGANRFIVVKR